MYRKQDFKSSSVIGYGGYRDRSVMGMDNILHNRKSKPCSGRFGCDKWCENFFHLSFGDAAAGVFDSDVKLIAFGPYVKADGTGTMDGFSGIFQKIQYGLPEFTGSPVMTGRFSWSREVNSMSEAVQDAAKERTSLSIKLRKEKGSGRRSLLLL